LEEDRNMGDEVWAEVKRATKNKGFGGQTKTPAARIVQSRKRDGKRDRCEWGGWLKKECGIRVSEDDPDDKKNVEDDETKGDKLLNDHESGVVGIRQAEVGVIKVSVIGYISQRHLLSENPTLANTVRLVETTDDSLETDVEAGLDDDNVSVVNVSGLVEDEEDAVGIIGNMLPSPLLVQNSTLGNTRVGAGLVDDNVSNVDICEVVEDVEDVKDDEKKKAVEVCSPMINTFMKRWLGLENTNKGIIKKIEKCEASPLGRRSSVRLTTPKPVLRLTKKTDGGSSKKKKVVSLFLVKSYLLNREVFLT
jgi:hypothetical protein